MMPTASPSAKEAMPNMGRIQRKLAVLFGAALMSAAIAAPSASAEPWVYAYDNTQPEPELCEPVLQDENMVTGGCEVPVTTNGEITFVLHGPSWDRRCAIDFTAHIHGSDPTSNWGVDQELSPGGGFDYCGAWITECRVEEVGKSIPWHMEISHDGEGNEKVLTMSVCFRFRLASSWGTIAGDVDLEMTETPWGGHVLTADNAEFQNQVQSSPAWYAGTARLDGSMYMENTVGFEFVTLQE